MRREALLAAHVVAEDLVGPLLRNVLRPVMDTYIEQGELLAASIGFVLSLVVSGACCVVCLVGLDVVCARVRARSSVF